MRFVIDVRDFVYLWLTKTHGESFAKKEHEFRLLAYFILYYMALVIALTFLIISLLPSPNISTGVSNFFEYNILSKLLGGVVLFTPYYLLMQRLLKHLTTIPVDFDSNRGSYQKKKWITIVGFIGSFLLILLIGALNNIIRFGHL